MPPLEGHPPYGLSFLLWDMRGLDDLSGVIQLVDTRSLRHNKTHFLIVLGVSAMDLLRLKSALRNHSKS